MEDIRSHTALRGFAALLVVMVHYGPLLRPALDLEQYTHTFSRGYLWVDFFFMLSGYILCHVYAERPGSGLLPALTFLWARVARIFPLHLASLLFLVTLQLVIPIVFHREFRVGDWSTFWLNVLNIHAWGFLTAYDWNFPSWSISAEFAAYLSFPFICAGLLRKPKFTIVAMVAAVVLLVVSMAATDLRMNWERIVLLRSFPMFFLGVLLYRSRPWCQKLESPVLTGLQLFSVFAIAISLHYGWNDALLIAPLAMLIFSTQTDAGALGRILTIRPLVLLGLWSYSIYMLHISVRIVLYELWPKLVGLPMGLSESMSAVLFFSVAIIITLIASAMSYTFFELPARMALRRWFASTFGRKPKVAPLV